MSKVLTEDKFNYQMLDRMKSDCEYFLGNGNRNPKHLWALEVDGQINAMKCTWKLLKEKPEWCTWEDILEYERKMKEKPEHNGSSSAIPVKDNKIIIENEEDNYLGFADEEYIWEEPRKDNDIAISKSF